MRLSVLLPYDGRPREVADSVPDLEAAGIDGVWVPEVWGFDSPTLMGYLAARTSRISICAGVLNVYSRSAALIAQTVAGLDHLSRGRAVLGLGTSGPQVVEGWHGVPFERPLTRVAETITTVRTVLAGEPIDQRGRLARGRGTGLGKPLRLLNRAERPSVPIAVAALGPRSVRLTAALADAWLPLFYLPERAASTFAAPLAAGAAERDPGLAPLRTIAGGFVAVEDDLGAARDAARAMLARYIGAMGAPGANFYFDLACRYGFATAADEIQERFLAGDPRGAERCVPDELVANTNLIGSASDVRARVDAAAASGVDELMVMTVGSSPDRHVRALRALI